MANALLFRPRSWASVTAGSTASGFSAGNLFHLPVPRMGRVWRSAGNATESLIIDLGANQLVDTIALFGIGAGNSAPGLGWQYQINLATQAQGGGFGAGAFWSSGWLPFVQGAVLPVSGRAKQLWLAPAGAPTAARYVRLLFQNLGTSPLQIALVTIGQRFQPVRNYSYGAAFGVRDLGQTEFSPRGLPMPRPGTKLRGMGLTFSSLRREEVEDTLQRLLETVGNTEPVVLVSDPDPHPQIMNRMGIGYLTGNLGSIHRAPGAFQSEINFVAVD